MATMFAETMPWHEGERTMHRLTKVPENENPNSPFLTPRAASMVQRFPLLALGTLDKDGRPWATIWGGEPPFAQQVAPSILGIRTTVDVETDPVVEILFEGKNEGEVVKEDPPGRMIGGLSINLEQRNRVKLYGRMVAGALSAQEPSSEIAASPGKSTPHGPVGQAQLVVKIEQSLGNCPKYINGKQIIPTTPTPRLLSSTPQLPPEALALLATADLFFITSAHHTSDMDLNHRGGPAGFIRVFSNEPSGAVLVWPELSGNNLYQTLGNLQTTPRAGLVVPDFTTGDALYLTGNTEVLIGPASTAVMPHTCLSVRLTVTGARLVATGLPFRGIPGEASPYNPPVRFLAAEKPDAAVLSVSGEDATAKLVAKTRLTPTITRYRFALDKPRRWEAGQYALLSFADELDMGYSHMRDDDPKSLNDDYLRTFTVSNAPGGPDVEKGEFEMTIRNVGSVTGWLARQSVRAGCELPLKGFAGEFKIVQEAGQVVPFVAAGIGVTPLLGQVAGLDGQRLRVFWTVGIKDIGFVADTFQRCDGLAGATMVFLTGDEKGLGTEERRMLEKVLDSGAKVERRRIEKGDLKDVDAQEWYLCVAPGFRKVLLEWLKGKKTVYEDFGY